MNNVENLLQQILNKMSEMVVVQAKIAQGLERISDPDAYCNSLSDVYSAIDDVRSAVEGLADNLKNSS